MVQGSDIFRPVPHRAPSLGGYHLRLCRREHGISSVGDGYSIACAVGGVVNYSFGRCFRESSPSYLEGSA